MNIDKFGRSAATSGGKGKVRIIRQDAFPKTLEGNYDVENHKLCNVLAPTIDADCVNKQYVDDVVRQLSGSLEKSIDEAVVRSSALADMAKNYKVLKQDVHEKFAVVTTDLNASIQELGEEYSIGLETLHSSLRRENIKFKKEFTAFEGKLQAFVTSMEHDVKNKLGGIEKNIDSIQQNVTAELAQISTVVASVRANKYDEKIKEIQAQLALQNTHIAFTVSEATAVCKADYEKLDRKLAKALTTFNDKKALANIASPPLAEIIEKTKASMAVTIKEEINQLHESFDKQLADINIRIERVRNNSIDLSAFSDLMTAIKELDTRLSVLEG